MNAPKTSKFPWPHKLAWICIVLVSLLFVWWGIPTIRKWRADKLVDELCAKDGGIRVYETVTLPSGMFNEYGQPKIRFWNKAISGGNTTDTGLYFRIESEDIVGDHNVSDISKLVV